MKSTFTILPAYTVRPGTIVDEDGVVFSAVFRNCSSCGLILYHLPDLKETRIPFTDDYRYGSLYSCKIMGLNPKKWAYRYYRDEITFDDPYARELINVSLNGQTITLGKLFSKPENSLPAYGSSKDIQSWPDEILYCMHVRGFTASHTSKVSRKVKGTYRGVIEKIPYLKELGITGVELLPIYELCPSDLGMIVGEPKEATKEDRERTLRVTQELENEVLLENNDQDGEAKKQNEKTKGFGISSHVLPKTQGKVNYWGFGEGCYFAPKRSYASTKYPQDEFKEMVDALHENGIRVFLQLYFTDNVSIQTQVETAQFYVTHYQVDGFHLKGNSSGLKAIASDPMLSDTALFYYHFPYEELGKEDRENPTAGKQTTANLCEYQDDFEQLCRRFVKSDNYVLKDFIKRFLLVSQGHGNVHYVTNYEGFTLEDLVSYNGKHNEANGEDNQDGVAENLSWNCGVEGPSRKRDIRQLRTRQMRNFMTLNLLAQGIPLILAGDECGNSQNGNNNVYCQDNETGWMKWKDTVEGKSFLDFTKKIIAFRKKHAVLRRNTPFTFMDSKAVGYPDVSLHGQEAWKADLSDYSHTIGILYAEDYAEENPSHSLLYLAINMYWHNQQLALPKPPEGTMWKVVMNTFLDDPFDDTPMSEVNPHHISVCGRSIQILETVPIPPKEKKQASPIATVRLK